MQKVVNALILALAGFALIIYLDVTTAVEAETAGDRQAISGQIATPTTDSTLPVMTSLRVDRLHSFVEFINSAR